MNHPADPGGATNYGISLRYLEGLGDKDLDGWLDGDLDKDGDVDIDDIRVMGQEDARKFYNTQWWGRYKYWQIEDDHVATKLFDVAVNTGPGRGHRLFQQALNVIGSRLKVDGVLGPKTLLAANAADRHRLLAAFRIQQEDFYFALAKKKPSLAVFLPGWRMRAMF